MNDELDLDDTGVPSGDVIPYRPTTKESLNKHVAAIHMAADLTTTDRKLLNVLLLNAWDDLSVSGAIHCIPVSVVAALIGWSSTNLTPFKDTLKRLNKTQVEFDVLYDDEKEERLAKRTGKAKRERWNGVDWTVTNIISGARIVDGMIYYEYSTMLRKRLANPEVYAVISIPVQRDFSGTYALALYENCVRFKGVKTTGAIGLDMWKALLGVDRNRNGEKLEKTAYDQFKHFNNQVIQPSIREINEVSDIRITPEFIKTGRSVTAIAFHIDVPAQGSLTDNLPRDDDAVRESEAYRLLTSVGVGRTLALEWVTAEPEFALHTARTVKAKFERKEIRNAVGYARRMMENKPEDFTLVPDEPPAPARPNVEQSDIDAKAGAKQSIVAQLTEEETTRLRDEYIAKTPGAKVSARTGRLPGTHAVALRNFMIERAPQVIASRG